VVIVDPAFISSYYALQEAIIFCFISSQEFLTGVHVSFLEFRSHLFRHLLCILFVELQHIMDDMVR
jgi:hypothetical protein